MKKINFNLKNIVISEKPSVQKSLSKNLPQTYTHINLFGSKSKGIELFSNILKEGNCNIFVATDPSTSGELLYGYFKSLALEKIEMEDSMDNNINEYRIALFDLNDDHINEQFKESTIISFNNLDNEKYFGSFQFEENGMIYSYSH